MPETQMTNIQELIESRAIERVLSDYAYFLDQNMPERMVELFVDDCQVSYAPNFGANGKKEYAATLAGIGTFFEATSHHNTGTVIDFVSPTEAHARTIVLAFHRYRKDRPDGILYGQYHDILVKINGSWKFKRRELRETMSTQYHVRESNSTGRAVDHGSQSTRKMEQS